MVLLAKSKLNRIEVLISKASIDSVISHFLILASAITGCVSISSFASLVGIPI